MLRKPNGSCTAVELDPALERTQASAKFLGGRNPATFAGFSSGRISMRSAFLLPSAATHPVSPLAAGYHPLYHTHLVVIPDPNWVSKSPTDPFLQVHDIIFGGKGPTNDYLSEPHCSLTP